eukprot:5788131-Amphidinium_carterae.1
MITLGVAQDLDGVYRTDEDAEMAQVEPESIDGVMWCYAEDVEELDDGAWKLRAPSFMPPLGCIE